MSTHYSLLRIDPAATPDEVKRAFRREVSRYHPDKVQHLGPEFGELATSRSAALTEAYRVLVDPVLRRQYDEQLGTTPAAARDLKAGRDLQSGRDRTDTPESATTLRGSTSLELVRRAVLMKIHDAAAAQGGTALSASGFDAVLHLKGRKALFRGGEPAVRVAVRLVPTVDVGSVEAAWPAALRCAAQGETVCLILLGSGMAAPRDLAAAISDLRRKSRGTGPVVVPVDIRDWQALFPPQTPASVRCLLNRVRNNQ